MKKIKIEHFEESGIAAAMRGMRNPLNSWELSDSDCVGTDEEGKFKIGTKDELLAKTLIKAGVEHRKFLRFITVTADITAPLYWWKQWDTYKVGTVSNSCSTMHKLAYKEFEITDFAFSELSRHALETAVETLNVLRDLYLKDGSFKAWHAMNELLPHSYLQKRTVLFSYENVYKIANERAGHKLSEWAEFIKFFQENSAYGDLLKVKED